MIVVFGHMSVSTCRPIQAGHQGRGKNMAEIQIKKTQEIKSKKLLLNKTIVMSLDISKDCYRHVLASIGLVNNHMQYDVGEHSPKIAPRKYKF